MRFNHFRRRDFITLLGSAAVAWPARLSAQQAKGPIRIGLLPVGSPSNTHDQSLVEAFRQGLRQAGLVENRDIVLDVVWISGDPDQAVTELMQRGAQLLIRSDAVHRSMLGFIGRVAERGAIG
jgi:putative ABC transport system substrate-binding protein